MANFNPVCQAEISARLPKQIFLKRRLRLHEESFIPGQITARLEFSSPGGWNLSRANGLKNLM